MYHLLENWQDITQMVFFGRNLIRVVFNDNSPIASDTSIDTKTCAKAIQELLDVRDRLKVIPELNYNDVDVMIEDLCCM